MGSMSLLEFRSRVIFPKGHEGLACRVKEQQWSDHRSLALMAQRQLTSSRSNKFPAKLVMITTIDVPFLFSMYQAAGYSSFYVLPHLIFTKMAKTLLLGDTEKMNAKRTKTEEVE